MVSFTSVAAATLAMAGSVMANSAECPFNYPSMLNTTSSHNGLVFTVASNNPLTNNRAIQLRPAPYIDGGFFGGVDNSSAVLLGNLQDSGLYSEARDISNQLYELGPTAYLNLQSGSEEPGAAARYSFVFANASVYPGQVERAWSLTGSGSDGTYGLYHAEPNGVAHGFLLCAADIDLEHGPWYQLFYQRYTQTPPDYPGCESVGIRTTVAASIINGACNIGGYTA